MGPYFLFITANWSWTDSRKSFSTKIDQQSAIGLSFLIGDTNVAPYLLKAPVAERVKTGRSSSWGEGLPDMDWLIAHQHKQWLNTDYIWLKGFWFLPHFHGRRLGLLRSPEAAQSVYNHRSKPQLPYLKRQSPSWKIIPVGDGRPRQSGL